MKANSIRQFYLIIVCMTFHLVFCQYVCCGNGILLSVCKAEVLLHNFMSDDSTEISSLKDYTEIGCLFIKYNTVICSNAACERLFSLAEFVLRANRCQLSNESFEAQIILKSNLFPSKNQKEKQ